MNKRKIVTFIIMAFVILSLILGYNLYERNKAYRVATENNYNRAFYELVDYMQNVKTYLAKALITTDDKHGAETLTHVWREADLAQTYLGMLPLESQELENTEKFLHQVSEYSYTLSRKNIDNVDLGEEDINNLNNLYSYSVELSNVLNQLSEDITSRRVTWDDLKKDGNALFAKQVSNVSQDSFGALEENFHEYAGLIYDGAFSEHLTSKEKKGLTGVEIDEQAAREKVEQFIGKDRIKEINAYEVSENTDIEAFAFSIKTNENQNIYISISKIGGWIIYMNSDRNVETEIISAEEAKTKAKEYLDLKGFTNMKSTYYINEGGVSTINFAYEQNYNDQNVIIYPDLIKIKVALDNGEIIGIETTGYLNNHYLRTLVKSQITMEEAKSKLNKDAEITNQRLAIIPTEWNTEILCYEFQGKIDEIQFLSYINVQTGEEEDTLIITDTENGTLTE